MVSEDAGPGNPRIARAREVFGLALRCEPEQRAARIAEACAGDEELLAEVESLLEAHDRMGGFLETPAPEEFGSFAPRQLEAGTQVGSFTVIRVLGAGGSGTVYEAMQKSPRRHVALKVMHADLASEEARRRFRAEAEILGRLQHPDIAHVYEAGIHEVDGTNPPWFALELVEAGRNVVRYAAEEGLDMRARLALVERICHAIHHGHQKGIIHRDIKPANLLVDAAGRLKVIDFGIARIDVLESARATPPLVPHEVAGTLPYMSPEQCRLLDASIDVRSDVYALGVLAYELLTGRLPHEVTRTPITEATRRIREEAPPPLATFDRSLKGDVECIVQRALAKQRADRYQSAADLARDLRAFLESRPVSARDPGWLYTLRLLARRRTSTVAAVCALMLALVGGVIVSALFAVRAQRERRAALEARDLQRRETYVASLAAADAALRVFDVPEARRRLNQADPALRNWEWDYVSGLVDASLRTLRDAQEYPVFYLAASADGSRLVAGSGSPVQPSSLLTVLDADSGETVATLGPVPARIRSPVLGPRGRWLAWGEGSGEIVLGDADDPGHARRWRAHDREVVRIAVGAGGSKLASISPDGHVRTWSVPDGAPLADLDTGKKDLNSVAFDPAGRRLAVCGGGSGGILLWDPEQGSQPAELECARDPMTCLAFSPDGAHLVAGSHDTTLSIWDVRRREVVRTLIGRREPVVAVRYDRTGERIVSAHADGTLVVWDARTGAVSETLCGHTARINAVLWGARRDELHSASADGTVKTWRLGRRRVETVLDTYEELARGLAYSRDGEWLACAGFDGKVRVYAAGSGELAAELEGHTAAVQSVAFLFDGRRLVSGANDATVRLWDLRDKTCRLVCRTPTLGVLHVAVSADDTRIASSSNDGKAIVWDAKSGKRLLVLPHAGWVWSVEFSPDGRLLATACSDGSLYLWSASSGREVRRMQSGSADLSRAIFTHDGERVVGCTRDGRLRVWRVATGELLRDLAGTPVAATDAALSPDGTRLAVAAGRSIALWDLESGLLVLSLRGHKAQVYGVAFHPDGTQLASCSGGWEREDCSLRLWGRIPGEPWPPR